MPRTGGKTLSFVWLLLAAGFSYLANIDSPMVVAAWLSPVFLLRFTRNQHPVVGFLASLGATTAAGYLATRAMAPMPTLVLAVILVLGNALSMLPYVADRLAHLRLPPVWTSLLLPLGMVSSEFLQRALKEGLSWYCTAYSQYGMPALLQIASVTGVWGIVFLIHWLAPVVNAVWENGLAARAGLRPAAFFAVILTVVWMGGELRLMRAPIPNTVRVAGVVPPPSLDWLSNQDLQPPYWDRDALRAAADQYRDSSQKIQDRLFEMTESEARAGAKIVAWSEMAAWVFAADEGALLARAKETAARAGIHVMIGIASLRPNEEKTVENKAILLNPDGSVAWQYRKTHPVPGIEEEVSARGDGRPTVAQTRAGRSAAAICFDLDYPVTVRRIAGAGVDVLFAPSHDFQAVRELHPRMAVFRAVENGVALFRPVANGVGIATDAYGRTLASVGYLRSGGASLVAQLPVRGVRTLYSMWGDWFAWLCVFVLAALPARILLNRRKSQ